MCARLLAGGERDRPLDGLDDVGERDRRGRARELDAAPPPPPLPRVDLSRPARPSRLTSFCAVGTGMPVSAAMLAALARAPPQWDAALRISKDGIIGKARQAHLRTILKSE